MNDACPTFFPPPLMDAPSRPRRPSLRGYSLLPERPAEEMIGGRFRVEGVVGKGGTAEVFLTRDTETGQFAVVKRMRAEVMQNPELHRRFLLEAEALRLVSHPSVIRVLAIEQPDKEPPFLVLEPLEGESLGNFLKREGQMPAQRATELMLEVAEALEAVHGAGVVHRDIKPDNIFLVGPFGDPSHVKVLDFGMARLAGEGHDESSMSILGTVHYMAPEQILVEPVDERTDIYSLGVLLFRMVTGHLPFETADKKDLVRHQLFSPVPPASWLVDDLPPGLDAVIARATRKDPARRFESMAALGMALAQVLTEDPDMEKEIAPLAPGEDIYRPVSEKGHHAARILARAFGTFAPGYVS
jgi:eukaryotic-like serine/threonine-protein kinase